MAREINAKMLYDYEEGEKWYDIWHKKVISERKKIRLTVSYDMGWIKLSSGHGYDSLLGYAFTIEFRIVK